MKTLLPLSLLSAMLLINTASAIEKASEERLDEVVRRGKHVMPFDLELTTHIFSKVAQGGIQDVIAKDPKDTAQVKLIRSHLLKIAREFQQSDFSNPEKVHGSNMPGLAELRKAKPNDIQILYRDLPNGAEVTYSTNIPCLVTAIHQWFDAQLSDHARHSKSGHKMHHQP